MVAIYISPNQKMADIIKFIHKAFLVYSHEGAALYGGDEDTRAMVMSGDLNVNFASSDSAPLVTLLRDKFSLQLNNDPTISTTKSGTTIDAIFTRYMDNVQSQMYISYFSYHMPIITTISIEQNEDQSLA